MGEKIVLTARQVRELEAAGISPEDLALNLETVEVFPAEDEFITEGDLTLTAKQKAELEAAGLTLADLMAQD